MYLSESCLKKPAFLPKTKKKYEKQQIFFFFILLIVNAKNLKEPWLGQK